AECRSTRVIQRLRKRGTGQGRVKGHIPVDFRRGCLREQGIYIQSIACSIAMMLKDILGGKAEWTCQNKQNEVLRFHRAESEHFNGPTSRILAPYRLESNF